MPEIEISIGGRVFGVACQEGEEHYLQAAAQQLDNEASVLVKQMGRLSESRLLLMAGLMLADRSGGHRDLQPEPTGQPAEQGTRVGQLGSRDSRHDPFLVTERALC